MMVKRERSLLTSYKFVGLITLLFAVTLFSSSCEEEAEDIASGVLGSYMGGGTVDGVDFADVVVEITKLSNTRIKVSPVDHSFVEEAEFELLFNESFNIVTSVANKGAILSVVLADTPAVLGIESSTGKFIGTRL